MFADGQSSTESLLSFSKQPSCKLTPFQLIDSKTTAFLFSFFFFFVENLKLALTEIYYMS